MYKRGAAYPENLCKSVESVGHKKSGFSPRPNRESFRFNSVRNPKVKSGEEWWRVVRNSSPLATPVFIGVSTDLVKSEE